MREIKFRAEYQDRLYDVQTRLPKIIRHPRYKGWHKVQGYILRLVTEHPFANKRGYVLEHRLVMEEFLNRFLMPWEKIHHRDQNRENNEFSNLELFGKQADHSNSHLQGKRNPHGQFIADEPIFSELKYRLHNKNTNTTKIYTLATLIGTTFRRGQFQFRGRFTGLKDKNGKEIYEGDIVKYREYPSIEKSELCEIEWLDSYEGDGFKMTGFVSPAFDYPTNIEIIGNIYENPKLLEQK